MAGVDLLLTATLVAALCAGLLAGITWIGTAWEDHDDDLP